MGQKNWTTSEIIYLQNYIHEGIGSVSKALGRSYISVQSKVTKLRKDHDLIKYNKRKWTEDDITYLKQHYEDQGARSVAIVLNRTAQSVRGKVYSLKQKDEWD